MNTFVTTLMEALTATAEQDSNLKLIKWAVKVRNTLFLNHQRLCAAKAMKYGEKSGRKKRLGQLAETETWARTKVERFSVGAGRGNCSSLCWNC